MRMKSNKEMLLFLTHSAQVANPINQFSQILIMNSEISVATRTFANALDI